MVKPPHRLPLDEHAAIRPYRFPALSPNLSGIANADPQQAFQQGYQQGMEQGVTAGQQVGHQEGYQQGLEQGLKEGMAKGQTQGERQGRARFEQAMAPLQSLMSRLAEWEQAQLASQQALLLQLVEQVAQQVVQHELQQAPEQRAALVAQVLARLPSEIGPLKIWLHPDDVAALQAVGVRECQGWPLLPETALARGDCRIGSPDGTIESLCADRLAQSMAHVRSVLTEAPC